MENATKALIMAASVLIAIVIIGSLLLMFNSLSSYQKTDIQGTRDAQVIEFNNQYEIYNQKNVRGSELYSLLNKVVDYNRRRSEKGTEGKDQGQYLAYKAMTISYDLKDKEKELTLDQENRIFDQTYNKFTLSEANTNTFKNYIENKINNVTTIAKNETSMQNLVSGAGNLFNKTDEKSQLTAIKLWNANASTTVTKYDEVDTDDYKEKVYTYYEFMQFKRAKFDCVKVEYHPNTGRIIEMQFEFTGKFD